MEYNLVADGGGSKVYAILYDENFMPIRIAKAGSMRENYTSAAKVAENADAIVEALFSDLRIDRINRVGGCVPRAMIERIHSRAEIGRRSMDGEPGLAMSAANLSGDALISLSGTGASTYYIHNGENVAGGTGGFGAVVFDEGSGYHIGREACKACILAMQNRGPETILSEMIAEHFGAENFVRGISSIYNQQKITSPISGVASCSPLVDKAAEQGDKVALRILTNGGWCRAAEMLYVIEKYQVPRDVPVTLTGGVWRGHPRYFESFLQSLDSGTVPAYPKRRIVIPQFEPILGAMLVHARETYGKLTDNQLVWFKEQYPQFVFRFQGHIPERR